MPDSIYGIPQPSSSLYIINQADVPPTNSNPMDDEFEGNILNPKWTIWNQPTGGSVTVHDSLVTLTSPYTLQSRIFSILQPAPSGNWKFRTKLIHEGATYSYYGIGLIARRITGGDKSSYFMSLFNHTQGLYMMSLWAVRFSGTTFVNETDLYNHQDMRFYMEMEYDGTNLTWNISHDGLTYSRAYQYAVSSYPGGIPEWIGINMHNYSSPTTDPNMSLVSSCDWFRRIL